VSRYQKGKTNLDFTEARDSEWQWHQLGHMLVCTSLQIDATPHNSVLTGQMPFLSPNQQHQSTEGTLFETEDCLSHSFTNYSFSYQIFNSKLIYTSLFAQIAASKTRN